MIDATIPADPLDHRRRRLAFRATHRGTQEADLLIGGFVLAGLAAFDARELDELEALLELPDVALADWLTGRQPIPSAHECAMLRRMRDAAGAFMP
jgi:antitoxin CptB